MKFLLKILFYTIFFILTLILFLPKQELYFLLEKKLENKNIIISKEKVNDGINYLSLSNFEIYYDKLLISEVESLTLDSYLFFSKINIKNLKISDAFNHIFPSELKNIEVNYNIIDFNKVTLDIFEDDFSIKGIYLFGENKINFELILKDENKITNNKLIRYFNKIDGKYYYEYKF